MNITPTGRMIDPTNPNPLAFSRVDIMEARKRIYRFNGCLKINLCLHESFTAVLCAAFGLHAHMPHAACHDDIEMILGDVGYHVKTALCVNNAITDRMCRDAMSVAMQEEELELPDSRTLDRMGGYIASMLQQWVPSYDRLETEWTEALHQFYGISCPDQDVFNAIDRFAGTYEKYHDVPHQMDHHMADLKKATDNLIAAVPKLRDKVSQILPVSDKILGALKKQTDDDLNSFLQKCINGTCSVEEIEALTFDFAYIP